MVSHMNSQYTSNSFNEGRGAPLKPTDRGLSYQDISDKRSAFLDKVNLKDEISWLMQI